MEIPERHLVESKHPEEPKEDPSESMTMPQTILWRIIFLSCLSSLTSSQKCKWLHPQQEYLNKQILQTFNQMSSLESSNGICPENVIELPNVDDVFNVTQVEESVIMREVFNQTVWFYDKHHTKLHCHLKPWERLQALLHYVGNLLNDCISEGTEASEINKKVSGYFKILEKNVMEQDNECIRNSVHIHIKKNLQLASQLSSRVKRRHLLEKKYLVY